MMTDEEKREVADMIQSALKKHLTQEEDEKVPLECMSQKDQKASELSDPEEEIESLEEQMSKPVKSIEAVLIAVSGSKPGAGATHHAILIARAQAKKDHRVALFDMSATKDLSEEDIEQPDIVDLYKNATMLQLDKIIYNYDVIVIDMGHYCDEIKNLFVRCDQKIIVCGGSSWEMRYLLPLFSDVRKDYLFLFNHVSKEERRQSILSGMSPLSIIFAEYTPDVLTTDYMDPLEVLNEATNDQPKGRWRG